MKNVPRLVETAVKESGVYYVEVVFEISKTRFNKLENSVFGTDFTYKGNRTAPGIRRMAALKPFLWKKSVAEEIRRKRTPPIFLKPFNFYRNLRIKSFVF